MGRKYPARDEQSNDRHVRPTRLELVPNRAEVGARRQHVVDHRDCFGCGLGQSRYGREALADGSRVTVGGKSGIVAKVGKESRRVTLERGQAFFEVAHDPSHPFVVVAGDAEITVRGTKFDVRRIGDDVTVNVLEGKVEVEVRRRGVLTFLSAAPDAVLVGGEASELKPDADAFAAAAPAATGAGEWRTGRLYYADAPLLAIVADAQRYAKVRIEVPSGAVGAMSLTVSYRAGDIEGLSDSIEAALPVRVEPRNDGLVIVAE